MIFDHIYGHKKQIEILKSAILNDRVSHAYLFVGIDGVGKRTVAFALARALNCLHRKGEGCEQCASCKKIDHDNHPDIRVVVPEKDYILINQIRQLQREMSFALYEASYRVVIFDSAEKMNPAAANCLLKVLEEPPKRTVIVLVSKALHLLLPTIISRCQKIGFNPLPLDIVTKAVLAQGKADEKTAVAIAGLSEGSLGRAFELLENPYVQERKTLLGRILTFSEEGISELFNLADTLSKNKDDFQKSLEAVKTLFRDLLIWRHFQDRNFLINRDLDEEIEKAASRFNTKAIIRMMEVVGEVQMLLERNINNKLLAEKVLLEMRKVAH
jgi:DNA polymerase-3 subunit delta'